MRVACRKPFVRRREARVDTFEGTVDVGAICGFVLGMLCWPGRGLASTRVLDSACCLVGSSSCWPAWAWWRSWNAAGNAAAKERVHPDVATFRGSPSGWRASSRPFTVRVSGEVCGSGAEREGERRRSLSLRARFVFALAEDREREGEEEDQKQNQDSERQPLAHPVSSLGLPSATF